MEVIPSIDVLVENVREMQGKYTFLEELSPDTAVIKFYF